MKKYFQRISLLIALALALAVPVVAVVPAAAGTTPQDQICSGIGLTGSSCSSNAGASKLQGVVGFVVNLLSWIVGIAAIIMMIIAGIKYVTSGGESSSVASAKNTLIFALIGLVIAALAQVIVHFVLGSI